jgi:organic radical activating enzyme
VSERDPIDEHLGLGPENALPSVQVMTPEESQRLTEVDAEDDYEFARRNIKDAVTDTKDALATAIDVVTTGGEPKQVEALASLLDKYVQANRELVEITAKPKKENGDSGSKVVNNTQNITFVGTTDDMLKAVRKARGERDIEDELDR